MFPRNHWYLAAFDDEIGRHLFPLTLLNEPVVMFRQQDGTPVALEDRCAHRHLPLSKGRIVDNAVQCGYHGVTYDCAGACVHVPGQSKIPPGLRVKSYPVIEQYRCIWIWMGDPALADAARLVDMDRLDENPDITSRQRLHPKCNYQLILDNLADLSHLGYVHASNVGTEDVAEHGRVTTERDGDNIRVSRWTIDRPPPASYVATGGFKNNIDRWQIFDFLPPCYFRISFGAAVTGKKQPTDHLGPDSERWGYIVYHAATPETDRSSHYFWIITPDFGAADTSNARRFFPEMPKVIGQDFEIFEAQQRCHRHRSVGAYQRNTSRCRTRPDP